MRAFYLVLLLWLAGCQSTPADERPDTLVDLATVQSGPQVQAEALDGAIRQQPDNAGLLARRAGLRLAAGQPRATLPDIEAALKIDDEDGELWFLQARAYRAMDRLSEALVAARRAADNGYEAADLPLLEGETHLAARQYPAALASLDRTLRLDPDQPAALFYKGLALAATQDTTQALGFLQTALARDPREPEILHQLAALLNAYRVPEEAAAYAAQGLRLDSTSGALHYDYGRQLELLGQVDSARYYYRRALALDTTQYRADYRLALAASAHGQRPASVIAHLRRALRQNPRLPQARAILAEALEAQHRLPEALRQYRMLVLENPSNQHWTYKVWKVGEVVRASLPDSLRPAVRYYARPAAPLRPRPAVAPLPPR